METKEFEPRKADSTSNEIKDAAWESKKSSAVIVEQAASSDPFVLEGLKLSQNFGQTLGVKKLMTKIPIRKPDPQWFVRVHPDESCRILTAVLNVKDDREGIYLVSQDLWDELASEVRPTLFILAINRQNMPFLWPIQMPGSDGKHNEWHASALDSALNYGTKNWIRVKANMSLGGYEVSVAQGELASPTWPEMTLQEIIRIAFRDRIIQTLDHPVIRSLRGLE